jgi:hypothetical protein
MELWDVKEALIIMEMSYVFTCSLKVVKVISRFDDGCILL